LGKKKKKKKGEDRFAKKKTREWWIRGKKSPLGEFAERVNLFYRMREGKEV